MRKLLKNLINGYTKVMVSYTGVCVIPSTLRIQLCLHVSQANVFPPLSTSVSLGCPQGTYISPWSCWVKVLI